MGVLNRLAWGASDSFAVCMGLASTMVCMPEKYCGCSDDALVVAAVALYIACCSGSALYSLSLAAATTLYLACSAWRCKLVRMHPHSAYR